MAEPGPRAARSPYASEFAGFHCHLPQALYRTIVSYEKFIDRQHLGKTQSKFLSFHRPPDVIASALGLVQTDATPWRDRPEVEGIDSLNLVSELVKKALRVKRIEKRLKF